MINQIDCESLLKQSSTIQDDFQHLTIDSILPTRTLVFIGLNTGHIMIVKTSTLEHLSTVHAYDQHVHHLFALSLSALLPTGNSDSNTGRFVTQFKYLQERFEQHRLNRSNPRLPLMPVPDQQQDTDLDNTSYMLAIGYGAYACRSIPQLQQYTSNSIYLQTWSLDDFLS
jgi:hypothetical protein